MGVEFIDDGTFAFPYGKGCESNGLTIREYFAAKAMVALAHDATNRSWTNQEHAVQAVSLADALIDELNQRQHDAAIANAKADRIARATPAASWAEGEAS